MPAPVKCARGCDQAHVRVNATYGNEALCLRHLLEIPGWDALTITKVLDKDAWLAFQRQQEAQANARRAMP